MKEQPERQGGDARLKESEVDNYAVLLADFIARLKAETGVQLDATGVQNEPNVTEFSPMRRWWPL
jgi:O-glycosyl hydrolase